MEGKDERGSDRKRCCGMLSSEQRYLEVFGKFRNYVSLDPRGSVEGCRGERRDEYAHQSL
jgi:hypothetical protein